jgi:hypothetical protein
MHLITQPVHVLPCSNSAMKGNNGTKRIPWYCWPNHHGSSPVFHCWNQTFQIAVLLGCSPNVNSSWCREQHEGQLIWQYHRITHFQLSDVQVLWSWHHLCIWALLFSNQRFRSCSPTVAVGFVKLTLDSFCGSRVFKMNIQFYTVVCAAVLWFFQTTLLNAQ